MNKKFIARLLMLCLVLTFTTTYMVSGTFAKYTTTIEGFSSTATVAKFEVTAKDGSGTSIETVGLFDTILDTVDGNADADVETGKIAPGTKGEFSLVLTNSSDVSVQYSVDFEVVNAASVPLKFKTKIGAAEWSAEAASLTDIVAGETTKIALDGDPVTIKVAWQWVFNVDEAGDTADTTLGLAGTAAPSVTMDVTFTQAD